MTRNVKRSTDRQMVRLAAAGALVVASACAAPILATETFSGVVGGRDAAPVHCGVAIDSLGGMTTFRPWVRLDGAAPGSYRFSLSGGGTEIDQGGGFDVGANGRSLLGEATVSGPASNYDVDLTVTVGGTRYRCHEDGAEI